MCDIIKQIKRFMAGSYQWEYSLRSSFSKLTLSIHKPYIQLYHIIYQKVNCIILLILKDDSTMLYERALNEFAFYYKRIIRIERYLKDLIIEKYTNQYGSFTYSKLYFNYFANIRKDNTFRNINKLKNKTDEEKLHLSFDRMYLSEVFSFLCHKVFLKDKIRKIFFNTSVKTSSNEFRKRAQLLKEFRNCVCHFNQKQLKLDKSKFIDELLFFEKLLNCRYKFTHGSIDSISHKLSITSILQFIYDNQPEFFNDDRILVNIYDDIAALADFRTDNLPSYASIIRAKFKLEEKYKI